MTMQKSVYAMKIDGNLDANGNAYEDAKSVTNDEGFSLFKLLSQNF
jgi:hypothetical protein